MIEDLRLLVECESPSGDLTALDACARVLADLIERRTGAAAERTDDRTGGHPSLIARFGPSADTRVLLVGHLDTVWPVGTLAEIPFAVAGGRVTGPGCFDMKAGLVQGVHAVASLLDAGVNLDGVALLVTSDEETGSKHSRSLIEQEAAGAGAALVLEPAADGAVKTGRKGVSMYTLHIEGVAAHAGLEPEKGVNALVELAHQVLALESIARPADGTTVTATVAHAGSTNNVVPAAASLTIDVRAAVPDEQQRVDDELRALVARVPGAALRLDGGPNRPPLPEASSSDLFARALRVAEASGEAALAGLTGVVVGGGSDGNFTAGVGTPTLDGLGAVGAGAHARHEWVDAASMAPRSRLVAALVADLLA